ncbi:MAG: MFS transporter [Planctomycetaceae bacterium]
MPLTGKWWNLTVLAVAELLAMTLWFSASAVVPQLVLEWTLSAGLQAWMTMSVQIGFVVGALLSAWFNLADRISERMLFAVCAVLGAGCNLVIAGFSVGPELALLFRFLTGVTLAGVYPPGMKLMTTWCKEDRGLGIGILVGALTVGSATPHLLNALPIFGDGGMPPWRSVLFATSLLACVAGSMVWACVRVGPYHQKGAVFDWKMATRGLSHQPTRLANFGYFGHMWELYAMWVWVPRCLIDSYQAAGLSVASSRIAGFGTVAIGGVGCLLAGKLADRWGRTTITIASLLISGLCCLLAGWLYQSPILLTGLCLIWGFAVVADSAQFSAAISELADSRYVGTALSIQTSLGFLLTMVSIYLVGILQANYGWENAFFVLAIGPVFGIWSMWRLRQLPESVRMASGNR